MLGDFIARVSTMFDPRCNAALQFFADVGLILASHRFSRKSSRWVLGNGALARRLHLEWREIELTQAVELTRSPISIRAAANETDLGACERN